MDKSPGKTDKRKQLKEFYKHSKTDMGVYIIRSLSGCYRIESAHDLKGSINGTVFRLNLGNHPDKELQMAWTEQGENNFVIEILEKLEYDKDESKTDYSEELAILKQIWEEKMSDNRLD
jgi:hypothetical protein